jgi:hypothetical protein
LLFDTGKPRKNKTPGLSIHLAALLPNRQKVTTSLLEKVGVCGKGNFLISRFDSKYERIYFLQLIINGIF